MGLWKSFKATTGHEWWQNIGGTLTKVLSTDPTTGYLNCPFILSLDASGNPTTVSSGQTLTHYNMALTQNLAVSGTLVTGNLITSGFTLTATGGTVVNQF
jgi:hypothetical protein